jgi:hypothetical protein
VEWTIEFADSPFEVIVTTSGEATAAAFDEMRKQIFNDPRYAIVVGQKAWYGLMRMWQSHYGEGEGAASTRVVTSREEALEWVEGNQ